MQHNPSSVIVYCTDDYKMFSKVSGNRELNPAKINRIMEDITKNNIDVLKECPILVYEAGEKLDIYDGQHRFQVSRLLKRPVHYILCDKMSILDIAKTNSNQESWKDKDFINSHIENGNPNYIALDEFMKKHKLVLTTAMNLLSNGFNVSSAGSKGKEKSLFKDGGFAIKYQEDAEKICEILDKFSFFKYYKDRAFITAICKIINANKVEIDDLASICKKKSNLLTKQNAYKLYIQVLEMIYNSNKHSRTPIW